MKKNLYSLVIALALYLGSVTVAFGQPITPTQTPGVNPLDRLQTVGTGAGFGQADGASVMQIIGVVISVLLSTLGMIFIILMIIAGFNWMTAAGDQEKIKKAGEMIRSSIIGLIIVVSAFAIWTFISRVLVGGENQGSIITGGCPGGEDC